MKFNVLIIKRNTIIVSVIIFLSTCLGFFYILNGLFNTSEDVAIPTMAKPEGEQAVKKDLNGDGKDDILYITSRNGKYYVEAHINNDTYFFNEKKPLNTLGMYYEYWPMTINIIDINRDRIPEIITQSSQDSSPVQHIFMWNGKEFKDIFCSTHNIIGILDSSNNKSPKFLSFTINKGISEIQQHMIVGKSPKNISYEKYTIPGLTNINQFINIISANYEITETPDVFSDNIPSNELSILWQLDKENYQYTLQDAFFRDDSWNNDGSLSSCSWTINFRKSSKSSPKDNVSQLNFKIFLEKYDGNFLIKSIESTNKK